MAFTVTLRYVFAFSNINRPFFRFSFPTSAPIQLLYLDMHLFFVPPAFSHKTLLKPAQLTKMADSSSSVGIPRIMNKIIELLDSGMRIYLLFYTGGDF